MKLKFMLVPLAILGLSVVGCSDEEKVAEKKKESVVNLKEEEVASKSTTNFNWITPKNKVCKANDGKIYKDDICEAKGMKAEDICRASGGRLPTIEELKEVVTDCGGINTTEMNKDFFSAMDKNKANKSYQSCYKNKGFRSKVYWSSSAVKGYKDAVWVIRFSVGSVYRDYKLNNHYVLCVRDGQ